MEYRYLEASLATKCSTFACFTSGLFIAVCYTGVVVIPAVTQLFRRA